jgi:hypothetical protein
MRTSALFIGAALVVMLAPLCAGADDVPSPIPSASISSQPASTETVRVPGPQPGDSATLEIAPQPVKVPPANDTTPAERAFKPSDDVAALNRNFHPDNPNVERRIGPADLGIETTETDECLLGAHEDGMEIVNVYLDSPAARAGLRGPTRGTRLGDLAAVGSILALPVGLFTMPMLRRSGMLGTSGDLIIAIDDRRIRDQQEFVKALSMLRPGDTAYLTVIRQVPGGHQSLRIAVHFDTAAELAKRQHDSESSADAH